ncbi:MAG: ATP-dependent deoxyribonuclease subunit A [Acidimicrobiia bacterium]|nr:ATP-dependent deoxyribonuclease subunit A [Acidimicrobiia bacterium]
MTVLPIVRPGGADARKPDDQAAREAIAGDLDVTLVVEAAAGTGKTTELVNRMLRVLETGAAAIDEIVAVTFTEKAAGELKLRMREALELRRAAAADDEVRQRLEAALGRLEEAYVNTIHGFCADLLRERPVEARVDPLFAVLTEPQAVRLYDRAFRAWLQDTLREPPEGVRRALRRAAGVAFGGGTLGPTGTIDEGPIGRLRSAGRALLETRDYPALWRRIPTFHRETEVRRLVEALHALAALSAQPLNTRDNLYQDLDAVRRLSGQIQLEQDFGNHDIDGWEARLVDLVRDKGFSRTRKGSGYKYSAKVTRTEVLSTRDALFSDLQQFKKAADADLAALLQRELKSATERYETLKFATGVLDFTDLLARARDLLRDTPAVRRHLQGKFRRIFVDEFQDTDPLQAEILLLLAAEDESISDYREAKPKPGKLFIVGDPKQSIYRFRGTDVETYWRVSRHIEQHGGRRVQLTTSFRSVPGIQRFVNAAFRGEMVADDRALQPDYVALSEGRQAHKTQPSVVALPVPRPYSDRGAGRRISPWAVERSLPHAVAAFVDWLIDPKNGWEVCDRNGIDGEQWVPLQAKHVAILFRRLNSFGKDVTRPYVEAIEARGIPHLLVGGKAFHNREEVEVIRAALAAIEWPDDELSVFATLRGSLFAIEDAHLLEYKARFGAFHPFRIPRELGGSSGHELALSAEETSHLVSVADALRLLQDLHRRRNYRPVADTVSRLLTETRAHVGFILRPAGEQALANVLHVAELARQYETAGGISFRGFIEELRSATEREAAEAPILEDSSDGVRLMTVHKAKGLEFPVVILADVTCRQSRADASRYVDANRGLCAVKLAGWAPHELHDHEAEEVARDEAEGVRLAYVAATRARDLLVVPAVGDEPFEGGWVSPLNRALYPPVAARRSAARAPACPVFKSKDTVLARPRDEPASPATVAPGLHQFAGEGGYSVVWWDPTALALEAAPPLGVRRADLVVKDVPRHVIADGRTHYDRWRLARADARARGAVPSLKVMTVRELSDPKRESGPIEAPGASTIPVSIVEVRDLAGPDADASWSAGGATFGTLIHAVLAQAPFEASDERLQQIADVEARLLGLPAVDAAIAARKVARVWKHELLARARRAAARGACRRETPVTLRLDDGTVMEGVVDLAFEEDARWVIVDYKTDRELTGAEPQYRRQVAAYAAAVSAATGAPASAFLVRT